MHSFFQGLTKSTKTTAISAGNRYFCGPKSLLYRFSIDVPTNVPTNCIHKCNYQMFLPNILTTVFTNLPKNISTNVPILLKLRIGIYGLFYYYNEANHIFIMAQITKCQINFNFIFI